MERLPVVTVFEHENYGLDRAYLKQQLKGKASTLYLPHSVKNVAEAIVQLGAPLTSEGEWIIDSRYVLNPDVDLTELAKNCDPEKVTLFKVSPLPSDKEGQKTTTVFDHEHEHGGLYYVGHNAHRLFAASNRLALKLYEKLKNYDHREATTRRYPYPICILSSVHDERDPNLLVLAFKSHYKEYNPDVRIFRAGHLSIREAHSQMIASFKTSQTVLVVDSDFELDDPNKLLMYEAPIGEEKYTHVWYAENPLNGLLYGHGAPKLFNTSYFHTPRASTSIDVTASTGMGLKIHPHKVGVHRFDTSLWSVWRTTFREVYKLLCSGSLEGKEPDEETLERLKVWKEEKIPSTYFSVYVDAVQTAEKYFNEGLSVDVNDYRHLRMMFDSRGHHEQV